MVLSCTMTRKTKLLSALRRELRISDGLVRRLKPLDVFRVNGERAHTNRLLIPGDVVTVRIEETAPDFPAEDGPLTILYEDECLIAVDKPQGVIVHPTFSRQTGTLANLLLGHYRRTGQACAVHVLTRLDRDTMGVVIFAKNAWAHWLLMEELDAGRVEKVYEALTLSGPAADEGEIDLPIAKRPNPSLLRYVDPGGKPARTRYRVLERGLPGPPDGPALCRLELRPLTGRTHQLRVHCAHEGFPILGDPQYGAAAGPYCRGGSYPKGEPPARPDDGTQNAKCKMQDEGSGIKAQGSGNVARAICPPDKASGNRHQASGDEGCETAGNRHQASGDEGCRSFDSGCAFAQDDTPAGTSIACPPSPVPTGQQLLAKRISLDHPLTGERLTFESKIRLGNDDRQECGGKESGSMKNAILICEECGSRFLASASKMDRLCPECASVLYGYENCSHVFQNGRCVHCLWDGSRSKYIQSLIDNTIS